MTIAALLKRLRLLIVIFSLVSIASVVFFFQAIQYREETISNQNEYKDMVYDIESTSNLISSNIRSYAQLGQQEYYDAYKKVSDMDTVHHAEKKLKKLGAPKSFQDQLAEIHTTFDELAEFEQGAIQGVQEGNLDIARFAVNGGEYQVRKDLLTSLLNDFNNQLKTYSDNEAQKSLTVMFVMIGVLIVMMAILIISSLTSFTIIRRKIKPLQSLTEIANRVANGDLTTEPKQMKKSKDEIAQLSMAIGTMVQNLKALVEQVQQTAEQVAASSEELSASAEQSSKASEDVTDTIQQLAIGSEQQVKSIEETTGIFQQLAEGAQQIASHSEIVLHTSTETANRANEGNKTIQHSVEQMQSIQQSVQQLSHVISNLGNQSKEIGQIVEAITSIADQTNLLALNAAIEAARAGEHGKGFAVVADEVRKLAEQSAQSANQISGLISAIQKDTNVAVQSMESTSAEVQEGIQLIDTAGQAFNHIQSAINEVTRQIEEVSASVQRIAKGTEEVVKSVEVINSVANGAAAGTQTVSAASEEQLASMEEIASSAHSLSMMSEELQDQVGKFSY